MPGDVMWQVARKDDIAAWDWDLLSLSEIQQRAKTEPERLSGESFQINGGPSEGADSSGLS